MSPVLIGAAFAVAAFAFYVLLRKSLAELEASRVRAEAPIRKLRRDPVTGEFRPH